MWDEYTEDIKSKYADIKNLGSGGAGTITAGAFLKEFVADTPWCHLDIAGTAWGVKNRIQSQVRSNRSCGKTNL